MIQAAIDLALLSIGLYLTSLWGEYLFDDLTGFSVDKNIMGGHWRNLFPGHFRTLLHLSYAGSVALNRKVFRLAAHPFFLHLGNIALHAINGVCLYAMLNALGFADRVSLCGAALFIAHPLAVNAVACISGRSSVLSGTFYFVALALGANGYFGLALLCVLPALWSKEDTITLPMVLGVMAYWQDHPAWWVLMAIPAMIVPVLWKWIMHVRKRTGSTAMTALGFPPPMAFPEYAITTIVETVLKYPQWLCGIGQNIDHDISPMKDERKVALACGILTMLAMVVWSVPSLQLPVLLMAVSPLLVYWFIVLPDPIAEHRAYVSLAGVAVLGAQITAYSFWLWAPLFIYFATRTLIRQHAWSDGIRLWERAFRDGSMKKPRVLANLNWAYQKVGDLPHAEYWAWQALAVAPNCFPVRYNLSRIAEDCGKMPEAIQIIEDAVRRSSVWHGFKRLGQLHERMGDFDKALAAYLKVIELNKRESDTWNQAGSIYFRQKKPAEALVYFQEAHRLDPSNEATMYNLGMCAVAQNDKDTARMWLEKMGPNPKVPNELKELCAV